jgi:hypothetical protein
MKIGDGKIITPLLKVMPPSSGFFSVPGMGDNSAVKVRYALGSRKR